MNLHAASGDVGLLIHVLGWTLLHFLWQGCVIAAAFGLVSAALRRASSAHEASSRPSLESQGWSSRAVDVQLRASPSSPPCASTSSRWVSTC